MYGNDDAVADAKKQIIYSIAGFLMALLAFAIVRIIVNIRIDTATPAPSAVVPTVIEETTTP